MGRKKNDKVLRLSTRRKNRRLAILRGLKKRENRPPANLDKNEVLVEYNKQCPSGILTETQNLPVRHKTNSIEDPKPGCSKDVESEFSYTKYPDVEERDVNITQQKSLALEYVAQEHNYSTEEEKEISKQYEPITIDEHEIKGRRLFDVQHLFKQILNPKRHDPFDCCITDMTLIKECRKGLYSEFVLQCRMCKLQQKLTTEDRENTSKMDANTSMTLAAVSSGIGHSQLEEIAAACNMPMMTNKTFLSYHDRVSDLILETAWKSMQDAVEEEKRLAKECGEVDQNGIPCITVVTDGAWAKRSYNVNYDSSSGVACIIGFRTGKLLYLGIRNKYCCVCVRHENKKLPVPTHCCYKNWSGTSTSMETDIIAEGFRLSEQLYGIKFTKMVGDGDSSVYKKLCEIKPYGNLLVQKVECKNHLMRNFCSKLREISTRKRSNSKNLPVPPFLRKEVLSRIVRLRTCISKAVQHRIKEDISMEDKQKFVISDIKNSPAHVFGEHTKCADIGYFVCSKKGETNFLSAMQVCGLYDDIEACLQRLITNVSSLILNMDNNLAEHYNSIVCKFVGGKRINFSLKGAYKTRCEAAAVSFNSGGDYYRSIYKAFTGSSPRDYTKKYVQQLRKARQRIRKRTLFVKKKNRMSLPDKDYGPDANANVVSLDSDEYNTLKEAFVQSLKKSATEIVTIERGTIGQSSNPQWMQERSIRLTASHFGEICKMRLTTSTANCVKRLLYSTFKGSLSTKYGQESEAHALKTFENQYNLKISNCGIFISMDEFYLGATPDGLIGETELVEVKCPALISKITPAEGILTKKIKFAEFEDNILHLNRNHNYFYQVQGQLAITKRRFCYFVIWSPFGLLVEKIERDENFWKTKMLPKLKAFYFGALLPELVDPQHPKGLPIRNILMNSIL